MTMLVPILTLVLQTATGVACGTEGPSVVSAVAPEYPGIALQARVGGTAVVEVLLDAAGKPAGLRLVKKAPLVDQAALDAAKRWRFQRGCEGLLVKLEFAFSVPDPNDDEGVGIRFVPPYRVEIARLPSPIPVNYATEQTRK